MGKQQAHKSRIQLGEKKGNGDKSETLISKYTHHYRIRNILCNNDTEITIINSISSLI